MHEGRPNGVDLIVNGDAVKARDRAIEHRSFYIVNAILVKGTRELAEALAARPEVARIEGNPQIHNDLPQPGPVDQMPHSHFQLSVG